MHGIPPDEVIRTDYTGSTKWRVTYEDHGFHPWWHSQRFFSTSEGSFYSFDGLDNSARATARVDLYFDFGRIVAPVNRDQYLDYGALTRSTLFKQVDISKQELVVMTVSDPGQFQTLFEKSPVEADTAAPHSLDPHMKSGDIFLFKTDEPAPRYGAIRIIEKLGVVPAPDYGPFRTVAEIIVQTDNYLVPLDH